MGEFKFQFLFLLFILVAFGLLYFAFTSLETGPEFAADQTQFVFEEEVQLLPPPLPEPEPQPEPQPEPEVDPQAVKLASDLQDLLDRGTMLEPGDSGLLVLRIQKFLNFYDKDLNLFEDQDFGPSTRKAVENFQKESGLNPDGGVGPKTLQKMLDYLES